MGGPRVRSERTARLAAVLGVVGAKSTDTYDFGDNWEHTIAVEKILLPEPGRMYPMCISGKLHWPPEDCGGVYGYYNLVEAINDSEHLLDSSAKGSVRKRSRSKK
jgi:hypothetical protein